MMADDDEPERIFQQAIRFHQAQKILERSPDDQREALVRPVCVLAASQSNCYSSVSSALRAAPHHTITTYLSCLSC
jgi:hypothetical protein